MQIHPGRKTTARSNRISGSVAICAVAIGFTICMVVGTGFSASRKAVPLRLEAALQGPTEEGYRLRVKLTNISSELVTIDELDLPWIAPNELEFLERAYRHDATRSILGKKGPVEDYFGRKINLQPGQSLIGTLTLKHYFSGLEESLKRTDVTVEWNCRSLSTTFVCNEGERGKLLVPKKRSGQKKD